MKLYGAQGTKGVDLPHLADPSSGPSIGRIETARTRIDRAFVDGGPVYLAFSGGKESALIAHLCTPYIGRFKLLWANTGFMFPHVEQFIREAGRRFGLQEIRSDLQSHWRRYGLPTEILPVYHAMDGMEREPKLQSFIGCCFALRMKPLTDFLDAQPMPLTLIHGQRNEDGIIPHFTARAGREVVAPIEDWSTEEVFKAIHDEDVALPDHYQEVPDSLDCWPCTGGLTSPTGRQRIDYMRRHYPQLAEIVTSAASGIHAAAVQEANRLAEAIAS